MPFIPLISRDSITEALDPGSLYIDSDGDVVFYYGSEWFVAYPEDPTKPDSEIVTHRLVDVLCLNDDPPYGTFVIDRHGGVFAAAVSIRDRAIEKFPVDLPRERTIRDLNLVLPPDVDAEVFHKVLVHFGWTPPEAK